MAKTHFYDLSEVRLQVIEAGNPSDPLLMLAHGFPEGAYSWRHQIDHFASRGWHVLAPYQRGYGESSKPHDVSAYTSEKLCGDLIELAHATGHEDMVLVGHDWGAIIGWDFYRMHPNHLRAYVGVSVPYIKWPMQPTELMKSQHGDRFFYMLYFQAVGPVEAELEAICREVLELLESILITNTDADPEAQVFYLKMVREFTSKFLCLMMSLLMKRNTKVEK